MGINILITAYPVRMAMAKSDHFFIRAQVDNSVNNYEETVIDLGAFVDALGKSILRIHSISVHYNSTANPGNGLTLLANNNNCLTWQLSTQPQTDVSSFADKSIIAMGQTNFASQVVAGLTNVAEVGDRVDQRWSDGYLVAVEQIYLGFEGGSQAGWSVVGDPNCTIIMDCTVEKMTETAAMSLALSQQ